MRALQKRRPVPIGPHSDFRLVRLFLFGFVGGVEGVLQRHQVLARFERIEHGLLGLELFRRVVGRLDRKPDAAVTFVDLDDARGDFLADLEHVLDLIDALFADLRDVHEAINVMLQADKRAEARQLRDFAADEITDLVILVDVRPGVFGKLFDPDRNALVALVDFQHHGLHFVAFLEDFRRIIDLPGPGDVGDVNHPVQTLLQFDEGTVAGEVANPASDAGARRIFLQRLVPRIGFELANAEGNLLFLAVDAQHDGFDVLALPSTSDGLAMRFVQESSVTCTRPSTPGSNSTKAPYGTRLTTRPLTRAPTGYLVSMLSHG